MAPAGTPAAVIEGTGKDVAAVLDDASVRNTLTTAGVEIQPMSPSAFGEFMASETTTRGGLVRRNGIKAD